MPKLGGRKPIPRGIKAIQGTLNVTRLNREEPQLPAVLPLDPPDGMDEIAQAEWVRLAPILYNAGVLTDGDLVAFESYCTWYARTRRAEAALKEMADEVLQDGTKRPYHALVIVNHLGNWVQNPLMIAARNAAAETNKYATDLGLTPSARSRIKANPPPAGRTAASRYLDAAE